MTTNGQMQIRFHKAPLETESYGLRTMPVNDPPETVEVEFPDGTTFYGVVTSESTEIGSQGRVVTKTVRVLCVEPEAAE